MLPVITGAQHGTTYRITNHSIIYAAFPELHKNNLVMVVEFRVFFWPVASNQVGFITVCSGATRLAKSVESREIHAGCLSDQLIVKPARALTRHSDNVQRHVIGDLILYKIMLFDINWNHQWEALTGSFVNGCVSP